MWISQCIIPFFLPFLSPGLWIIRKYYVDFCLFVPGAFF